MRHRRHLPELLLTFRGPTEPIDRSVGCRCRQPAARILWDAVSPPANNCQRERVLGALLGDIPVTGPPDQGRDDATPLLAKHLRDRGLNVGRHISQIGLTSIDPWRAPGIFDATSMASSRSLHSTT